MRLSLKIFLSAAVFSFANFALSEITMPRFFSDNMLLQREMPVKIWGKAAPKANVKVEFAGQSKSARADENGDWSLNLAPMKASAEPRKMLVYENSKLGKTIENVLVGELWLTGGQSNMDFRLWGITGHEEICKRATYPDIRVFVQPIDGYGSHTKEWDVQEGAYWSLVSPEKARDFHGVAYIFAENLRRALDVPVGVIQTAKGASIMFTWTPYEYLSGVSGFERWLKHFNSQSKHYDYEKAMEKYRQDYKIYEEKLAQAKADKTPWPPKPNEPSKLGPGGTTHMPSVLYNAKVAPFRGLSMRGFLWYQGEFDSTGVPGEFASMFKTMIKAWRDEWKRPDMPFYFVQLPSQENVKYAQTRWDQFKVFEEYKNIDMIVTIDTGEEKDNHPRDKVIVCRRIADMALNKIYKKIPDIQYGPIFQEVNYRGDTAHVKYWAFKGKLVKDGELRGFEVKQDGEWVAPQKVEIDRSSIIIRGSKELQGVRYLWTGWAKPNVCLRDERGLPAMSFISEKESD